MLVTEASASGHKITLLASGPLRLLVADVPGIEGARLVDVAGALDDGAAVGEHRELVSLRLKKQQEAVVTDLAQHLQVLRHLLEVQAGGRAMRHLHGVAAAQARRVRPLFTLQPLEAALATA